MLRAGDLDREITLLRKVPGTGFMSAGKETWSPLATVWAQVQDVLPSKALTSVEGLEIALRPARIRIRFRDDITADMLISYGSRTLKIVSGPAEIGRREGLELMAQDYSTQGTPA
jgi:head-tail adaptor